MKTRNPLFAFTPIIVLTGLFVAPLFAQQQQAQKGQLATVGKQVLNLKINENIRQLDSLRGLWTNLQQRLARGGDAMQINREVQRLEATQQTGTSKPVEKKEKTGDKPKTWGEILKKQSRNKNKIRADKLLSENLQSVEQLKKDLNVVGKDLGKLQTNLAQVNAAKKLKQEAMADKAMRMAKEKSDEAREMLKKAMQVLQEVYEREQEAAEAVSRI